MTPQPQEKDKNEITINRLPYRIEREIAHLKGKTSAEELATRFDTTVDIVNDIWAKTKERISITFSGMYTTTPLAGRFIIHAEARVKETLPNGSQILDDIRFIHGELILPPKEKSETHAQTQPKTA